MAHQSKQDFYLRVADCTWRLTYEASFATHDPLAPYRPFFVSNANVADDACLFHVIVSQDKKLSMESEEKLLGEFVCGKARNIVYQVSQGYRFVIKQSAEKNLAILCANSDFSVSKVTLSGTEEEQILAFDYALMIAFAFAAAKSHVLLIHASVVLHDGKGYLFLGKSGTGKSTHAALWVKHIARTSLLNDDNPCLRVCDDHTVRVYGTPWSGDTPCYLNEQVSVGAIVRLEQASANFISQLSPLNAFSSIVSSCSKMIWDKPTYDAILTTCEAIALRGNSYIMKCLPNVDAANQCAKMVVKLTTS